MSKLKLPSKEELYVELVPPHLIERPKEYKKRQDLVRLIEEYFGPDTELVLAIALFFKRPEKFRWLRKVIENELSET